MSQATFNPPILVDDGKGYRHRIKVEVRQLAEACRVLDEHNIWYYVDENRFSFNNGPFIALIEVDRKADAAHIQAIFDGLD